MKYAGILLAVVLLLCAGCTRVISDASMRLVDRSITFEQLKENPDRYIGKYVLVGGAIAAVGNTKRGGEIEAVQFRLDSDSMPDESYGSQGRFLAQADGFLDPLIYKTGRLVTIVGEVKGHTSRPLDRVDYDYPVVAIREIHIWSARERGYYPYPSYYHYDYPYYSPYPFYDPYYPYYYPFYPDYDDYYRGRPPYRPWPRRR